MIAETQPVHLVAISVSGLIDDLYRGLVYPGGVSNYGFPLLWTLGVRPAYDVGGGLLPGIVRPEGADDDPNRQEDCATNQLGKSRTVLDDPVLRGLSDTDNEWYRARSLITAIDRVKVPVHIVGAYQDEQTGPPWSRTPLRGGPRRPEAPDPDERRPQHRDDRRAQVPRRSATTGGPGSTSGCAASTEASGP